MDGTFKLVPNLFAQLYTIHGFWMEKVMPLAYCLLPDKYKSTYLAVFDKLQQAAMENGMHFNPQWIMLDFEGSALIALREVFPRTELKGCYFHFTQCIFRKVLYMRNIHTHIHIHKPADSNKGYCDYLLDHC